MRAVGLVGDSLAVAEALVHVSLPVIAPRERVKVRHGLRHEHQPDDACGREETNEIGTWEPDFKG